MRPFTFVILGAAKIAPKFIEAARLVPDVHIAAVASKSMERAQNMADQFQIPKAYDDYETMLIEEKPDAAYICVTPNDHFRLTMMCIKHQIPVLCEKAMFQNSKEALDAFDAAKEANVFVMEAMWSRFLPPTQKLKQWLAEGRIGRPETVHTTLGFRADPDPLNRYMNPKLGGGAAKDLTVYTYEQTVYIMGEPVVNVQADALWGESGVDMTDHVYVRFPNTVAELVSSFAAELSNKIEIRGPEGYMIMPDVNMPVGCTLYKPDGTVVEDFTDTVTKNGFSYEVAEVVRCVREGLLESPTVPWQTTIDCAKVFDQIDASR